MYTISIGNYLSFLSDEPEVHVVQSGKDDLSALVNIISYDLAVNAEEGILDALHFLSSPC